MIMFFGLAFQLFLMALFMLNALLCSPTMGFVQKRNKQRQWCAAGGHSECYGLDRTVSDGPGCHGKEL